MRIISAIIVIILALVAAAWLGGETWLAHQMRNRLTPDAPISAGQITELRSPALIGLSMSDVRITMPDAIVELPTLAIGLKSTSPTVVQVDLPQTLVVDSLAGKNTVQLDAPLLTGRIAPFDGFALRQLRIALDASRMDGNAFTGPVRLDADIASLGSGSPLRAQAAYDLAGEITDLDLSANPALASLPIPIGQIGAAFTGRIWLDRILSPAITPTTLPQVVGFETPGSDIILGDIRVKAIGKIEADSQGRAQGLLVIYTKDAQPILQAMADSGILPKRALKLASSMMRQISDMPIPQETGTSTSTTFPAPQNEELRLPIMMNEGRISLGALPLGAAPQIATPLE